MNKHFKLIILFLISFVSIYYAFAGESIDEILEQLYGVDFSEILIAVLLLIFSCIIRAYRWKILLLPFCSLSFHRVFSSTMIGYFGNGVLAFRLGEILKSNSVVKGFPIKTSQAFGTVILERILDLIGVLIIFIMLIPWFPFDDKYIRFGAFIFSVSLFMIIIFIFLLYKYHLLKKMKNLKIFSSGFGRKIFSEMNKTFEGIMVISQTKKFNLIFISSIFLWLIYFIVSIYVLKACSINLNIVEIGILLVLGSIAIGIPALPGSAGTYDVGIKYGLIILFNIGSSQALNYALVSHAVSYFPLVIIGFVCFLLSNISFADLKEDKEYL